MDNYSKSNSRSMSEDIREFGKAFLVASLEFTPTGKSGNNNHNKSKYAKLEDIYGAVQQALKKQFIAIWHFRDFIDGIEFLYTRLTHVTSGQYIEDKCLLETEKPGSQGKGSALTYMKRYAVLGLCGIAAEEGDDDGQAEEEYLEEQEEECITQEEVSALNSALKAALEPEELWRKIKGFNRIEKWSDLRASAFDSVMRYIKNWKGNPK